MRRFRDRDGDVWEEQEHGEWECVRSSDPVNVGGLYSNLAALSADWGPLTELDPSPTDLSAPATRGDVLKVLQGMFAVLAMGHDEAAEQLHSLMNSIKEGRA